MFKKMERKNKKSKKSLEKNLLETGTGHMTS
jgi:hypothetical protein